MIAKGLRYLAELFESKKPDVVEEYREQVINKANYLLQDTYDEKDIEIRERELSRLNNKLTSIIIRIENLKEGEIMKCTFEEWTELHKKRAKLDYEIKYENLKLDYMKQHIEESLNAHHA